MSRMIKHIMEPCCYHITHRCQERRFFFKFNIDRQNYVNRLREMKLKHNVDVLDYIITSNHVHLLLWSKKTHYVSRAMHFLQSVTAKDYNKRVTREGAFWRGRYHPTVIESGRHLALCLFYIDLNMVRAGVVTHPEEWKHCGYHEISGNRKRYCIINIDRLMNCLEINNKTTFEIWYMQNLHDELNKSKKLNHPRTPIWSESYAIGSREWIKNISYGLLRTQIAPIQNIHKTAAIYSLTGGSNSNRELWKKLQR